MVPAGRRRGPAARRADRGPPRSQGAAGQRTSQWEGVCVASSKDRSFPGNDQLIEVHKTFANVTGGIPLGHGHVYRSLTKRNGWTQYGFLKLFDFLLNDLLQVKLMWFSKEWFPSSRNVRTEVTFSVNSTLSDIVVANSPLT